MSMSLEAAEAIVERMDDNGAERAEVREDYSGRGMYGRTVVAVVAESISEFYDAALDLVEDGEIKASDVKGLGTDGMGRGIVIY